LRDRLAAADGKGYIVVRLVTHRGGDEQVPGDLSKRPQHREIADSLGA
jgi:hypothetical protein